MVNSFHFFISDFVFPEQLYANNLRCEEGHSDGISFCTKVQNYPKLIELDKVLNSELLRFETFFDEDIEMEQPQSNQTNIATRFSDVEPGEEFLCESKSSVIYPEAAMTKDSNWLLLVNNGEQYKQGVRIETCK